MLCCAKVLTLSRVRAKSGEFTAKRPHCSSHSLVPQFGYDLDDFVLVRVEVEVAVQVAVAVAAMWKTWHGDDADTPFYGA